jgi:hypothetical protein
MHRTLGRAAERSSISGSRRHSRKRTARGDRLLRGNDELAELARVFDRMAADLERHQSTLIPITS